MKKIYTIMTALVALTVMQASAQVNVTFTVDLNAYLNAGNTLSPNGVHVAGNFQTPNQWSPEDVNYGLTEVSAGTNIFAGTFPIDAGTAVEFKFINSNAVNYSWGTTHVDQEGLSGPCTTGSSDNRAFTVPASGPVVYFATWDSCTGNELLTGINNVKNYINDVSIFPNPSADKFNISFVTSTEANYVVTVYDITGKQVKNIANNVKLSRGNYQMSWDGTNDAGATAVAGTYFVRVSVGNNFSKTYPVQVN